MITAACVEVNIFLAESFPLHSGAENTEPAGEFELIPNIASIL